jgi:Protein of unknown function (DUF2867)
MKVRIVEPDVDANKLLPGAQFIDAYCVTVNDAALDARHAAEKMTARGPRWIEALLRLRNHLVAPFGLKTAAPTGNNAPDRVGIFPVISERPDRPVAGLDDAHLDFRLVVDVGGTGIERRVTATTLVLTHNWLGRAYLAIILPFHRLVVRAMLAQVAG